MALEAYSQQIQMFGERNMHDKIVKLKNTFLCTPHSL